jgi:CubicO group peptidase (beta-lactamase class C family)
VLRGILAAASWAALILVTLVTALLAGWVLLAAVLLGSGPTGAQPVPAILLTLLAATGGLAWRVARYVASPRGVGLAVAALLALVSVVGVTWALSAPDWALYVARDMAWDGTDVWQVPKFPERAIANAPPAFRFRQNLSPQLFQTIEYEQGGQLKRASFDAFLESTQTTSFIVIQDDAIRIESYGGGYTRDSVVTSFSIAKSVTSALVGIAIDEGYIGSVDDPIIAYLPELRGRGLDGVTIRHLLTMSTGIRFVHKDEQPPLVRPLPLNDMAWATNFPNLRSLALSVKSDGQTPGVAFNYNNYYPQLLGLILERTTHRPVSAYLQEKLWQPLGMEYAASWSLDSRESGFEKMESGLNARAVDFAKFGALYLNNGTWNGRQIVPERWVAESTAPDPDDHRPWQVAGNWKEASGYYKYLWWGVHRPDGSYVYLARGGLQQQWIYVSPRDRVVIVRFGLVEGGADWWPDIFETVSARLR